MVRVALLVIAICAVATSPLNAQRGGSDRSNPVDPAPDCGAKCLYVILRANSSARDTYQALVQELGPAPKEGYSFLQLRDSARSHGLYAECLRLSKEALISRKGKASVILHMTPNQQRPLRLWRLLLGRRVVGESLWLL